jgi:hypothetical protein
MPPAGKGDVIGNRDLLRPNRPGRKSRGMVNLPHGLEAEKKGW